MNFTRRGLMRFMKCNYFTEHFGAGLAQNGVEAVETSAAVQLVPLSFQPASGQVYVGLYEASHFFDTELYLNPLSHVGA